MEVPPAGERTPAGGTSWKLQVLEFRCTVGTLYRSTETLLLSAEVRTNVGQCQTNRGVFRQLFLRQN